MIKSRKTEQLIEYLAENFASLWQYDMKLNLVKCIFKVASGKLLRFVVSERGIDSKLDQSPRDLQWAGERSNKKMTKFGFWCAIIFKIPFMSRYRVIVFFHAWVGRRCPLLDFIKNVKRYTSNVKTPDTKKENQQDYTKVPGHRSKEGWYLYLALSLTRASSFRRVASCSFAWTHRVLKV